MPYLPLPIASNGLWQGAGSSPKPLSLDIVLRDSSTLGMTGSLNSSAILLAEERHTIQVVATATASLSIASVLCALYWFCMMRRNFRRDLVLLLIAGDFWKSLWYLVFSSYTLAHGRVQDGSIFCSAVGYLLLQGIESCDWAILFMSLHMHLQIFPPSHSFLGHDGLYRLRHWVVAAWFLLPNVSAGLAFVNPTTPPYLSTGAWCTLPVRPFWYRLALSWVPRYLIWIFVLGVATNIYRHVGREFQVFGPEKDESSSFDLPGQISTDHMAAMDKTQTERRPASSRPPTDGEQQSSDRENSSHISKPFSAKKYARDEFKLLSATSGRRNSTPNWSTTIRHPLEPPQGLISASTPGSRRGSKVVISQGVLSQDFAGDGQNYDYGPYRGSITTLGSTKTSGALSSADGVVLPAIDELRNSLSGLSGTLNQSPSHSPLQARRRVIQRQLRLLFIYPVVYMMLWIIPFVGHCMSYSDYYAQHPVYVLTAAGTFCQCFFGFADVVVFCWRERPWSHIPGSDGTVAGSFCFWRFIGQPDWHDGIRRTSIDTGETPKADEKSAMQARSGTKATASRKWWPGSHKSTLSSRSQTSSAAGAAPAKSQRAVVHRRQHSGGSDRRQLEILLAHERLAMERADWGKNQLSLTERRTSVVSTLQAAGGTAERKEWWNCKGDEDLFRDPKQSPANTVLKGGRTMAVARAT